MNITKEDIYKRIEVLNFTLWENRAFKTHIEAWLRKFKNETNQSHSPDDTEHTPAPGTFQTEKSDGRVGSGDEKVDTEMVDSLANLFPL